MSGYVEKYNDLLVDFNHLKNDNERTENRLNEIRNDHDARLNELHNNKIEIAELRGESKTDKK